MADDPSLFRRADSFIRGMANGLTFGYADKLAGWLGSPFGDSPKAEEAESTKRESEGNESSYGYWTGLGVSLLGGYKLVKLAGTAALSGAKRVAGGAVKWALRHPITTAVAVGTAALVVDKRGNGADAPSPSAPPRASLKSITFAVNNSVLTEEDQRALDQIAEELPVDGNLYLYGHASTTGTVTRDQALSAERVTNAKRYLIEKHHISSLKIFTEADGKTTNLVQATGDNVECEANRSVTYRIARPTAPAASPPTPVA